MDNFPKIENHSNENNGSFSWFNWRSISPQLLLKAETSLFRHVKSKFALSFIPINEGKHLLRTVITESAGNADKIPIVLLHGLCSSMGLWCKNIDALTQHRQVYALDLLGFGSSSRVTFPTDPTEIEDLYIESLEQWRQAVGLVNFILLGHSLGAYLACAYTMKHPTSVRHVIFADPWGFSKSSPDSLPSVRNHFFARNIFKIIQFRNPFSSVRAAGPLGPSLIHTFMKNYGRFFQSDEKNGDSQIPKSIKPEEVFDYIYQCNAQNPSGEIAFKNLQVDMGSARSPMIDRVSTLDESVPVSFIFGEKSWLDKSSSLYFYEQRPNSYVDIQTIPNVGHHIQVEDSVTFNDKINDICRRVDAGEDTRDNEALKINYELAQEH